MIRVAHEQGRVAALRRFKLADTLGADPGVMPSGEEQSHGTDRVQYARRPPGADGTSAVRDDMPDWLWDIFTAYDNVAPGRADGSYGQETIG